MAARQGRTLRMALTVASILFLTVSFAANAKAQKVLATIAIPSNDCCGVAVNVPLNKAYASGGFSAGQDVFVIDGTAFTGSDIGTGSGVSVDNENDNYWAATVFGGSAIARKGSDNSTVATVSTGFCPGDTSFDCKLERAWVSAQCGGGNDPVFVIDADSFSILAGPIGTGGVLGSVVVNSRTGRAYVQSSGVSKRINPTTFAVTTNAFGIVQAVNPVTGQLYAVSGMTLQIINGNSDPEVITASVPLSYSPSGMGVNNALNHLYLSNGGGSRVEVRNNRTGALITTFSLGAGVFPQGIGVDSTRGRLYVAVTTASGDFVYVIEDVSTARKCLTAGTC